MTVSPADERPLPLPDQVSAFFWDGAREGRLLIQRCSACTRYQYPPDVVCTFCQSPRVEPAAVSARGTLYSYSVVDRAFNQGFVNALPYVLALVELDEQSGLRMIANIVEAGSVPLEIGMPLEVTFEDRGEVVMPQFRPAAGAAS